MLMLVVFSCQEPITEEDMNSNHVGKAKQAQSTTVNTKVKQADVYDSGDEMPRFSGCEDETNPDERKKCAEMQMLQHIYSNVHYPAEARDAGIEGMAVVSFIVERDGQISNIQILRSVGYGIDEEVIRIVENMPNWTPGIHEDETVRVEFKLPIRFKLSDTPGDCAD